MDYGINLATAADSWKVVKRAEELGFTRAWFYDTQLLNADIFVAMGAAAVTTSRIRLGTGVLIPSNRIAPVAASALMSLNALAPGRIDFGISTGFTARRTMGVGPVRLADMRRYIEQVQRLIAGETVEWEFEGARRKMRFLSLDIGVVNNRDPIPLHISAQGPRARGLTAELGAHWINGVGYIDAAKASIAAMQAAWRSAGIEPATRSPRRSVAAACLPRVSHSTARAPARRPARTRPSSCTTWSSWNSSAISVAAFRRHSRLWWSNTARSTSAMSRPMRATWRITVGT